MKVRAIVCKYACSYVLIGILAYAVCAVFFFYYWLTAIHHPSIETKAIKHILSYPVLILLSNFFFLWWWAVSVSLHAARRNLAACYYQKVCTCCCRVGMAIAILAKYGARSFTPIQRIETILANTSLPQTHARSIALKWGSRKLARGGVENWPQVWDETCAALKL